MIKKFVLYIHSRIVLSCQEWNDDIWKTVEGKEIVMLGGISQTRENTARSLWYATLRCVCGAEGGEDYKRRGRGLKKARNKTGLQKICDKSERDYLEGRRGTIKRGRWAMGKDSGEGKMEIKYSKYMYIYIHVCIFHMYIWKWHNKHPYFLC